MTLIDKNGNLTQWGKLLADMFLQARGLDAARLAKRLVIEYGKGQAIKFINVITDKGAL